jgi:hypothetical protein
MNIFGGGGGEGEQRSYAIIPHFVVDGYREIINKIFEHEIF